MKKSVNYILFSGIWSYPINFGMIWLLFTAVHSTFKPDKAITVNTYLTIAGIALIPVGGVFLYNVYSRLTKRKTDFSFPGYFYMSDVSRKKLKSMYPTIDHGYLSVVPEGLILGKYKDLYVRIPHDPYQVYHTLVIGPPGSGKSSGPFLCSLLANYIGADPSASVFCIDIKPELALKSVEIKDNYYVRILSPENNMAWGWNVYYGLTENSSDDEVLDRLTGISDSLIPGDRTSPAFFVQGARNVFCGMMFYYYRKNVGFVDSIKAIITKDVSQHIEEILADTDVCSEGNLPYAFLNRYNGISGDAWDNICMYIQNPLQVFLQKEMIKMFQDCPRKADPRDLDRNISLFLSFPEESLKTYRSILNLITAQTLDYLQNRASYAKGIIYLYIDEFVRIGRLGGILDALATLRSRKVSIMLAVQDLSQLRTIYSRDEALTIVNLCKALCILDCQDLETCKMVSAMAGTYMEDSVTYSRALLNRTGRTNYGSVEKNIVEVSDIQTLSETREVILLLAGKYYRVKKAFYKTDPVLGPVHEKIMNYNQRNSYN